MTTRFNWNRAAQLAVVFLGALALKQHYAPASVDQLRWILAPTTRIVEFVTGSQFEFESHAGYMSGDHTFLIAASCAGVNFLITAFLMLSLRKLWSERNISWRFIPTAACVAYLATIVANTVRISTALRLQRAPLEFASLDGNQLHRFEGIFIYFGFLLLLFLVTENSVRTNAKAATRDASIAQAVSSASELPAHRYRLLRQTFFPLLIYYATTLGIPAVTAALRRGPAPTDFWEHSVFVVLTPLILLLPLASFQFARGRWQSREQGRTLVGQFRHLCPTNFSLSRRYDKLKAYRTSN